MSNKASSSIKHSFVEIFGDDWDDESYPSVVIAKCLVECLNNERNLESTANAIIEPVNKAFAYDYPDDYIGEKYSPEKLLWDLWSDFLILARHDNGENTIKREKLVTLIGILKDSLTPPHGELPKEEQGDWARSYGGWSELPLLGPILREEFNDYPPARDGPGDHVDDGGGDRDSPPPMYKDKDGNFTQEYYEGLRSCANYHSFMADLTKRGIFENSLFCLWLIRECLENDYGQKRAYMVEYFMPAAAAWVKIMGVALWNIEQATQGSKVDCGDPLWKGSPGLNKERYRFWASRFEMFSQDESLHPDSRKEASEAYCVMREIIDRGDS